MPLAPRGASIRMSPTRTSSYPQVSPQRSRRARRSSSPRTARTSRTSARSPACAARRRHVVRRAATVIAVSSWLRTQLEEALPDARGKTEVIDCGVDLERFAPRDAEAARRDAGLERRRHGVPLPRRAHGAQERPPPRARVRAARRGHADLRRRRPAAGRARRTRRDSRRRSRRTRGRPGLDHRLRRRLPAEPRRAVRPRDPRGHGVGALGRRDERRRPARVRDTRVRRPRRSARRRRPRRRRSRTAASLPRPNLAGRAAAGEHDVKRQAERVEEILLEAVRDRRA